MEQREGVRKTVAWPRMVQRAAVDAGEGAGAGLLATIPMSAVMIALHQLLPSAERLPLPPKKITAESGREVGLALDEEELQVATVLAHLGYGTGVGALFGPLLRYLPLPPVLAGVLYGLLVWFLSYMGWVPAVGVMAPATKQPQGRNVMMILSHVVWGAVAGWLVGKIEIGE